MKRSILSLGAGSLVIGAVVWLAGCEACERACNPCKKAEAKPACQTVGYRSSSCNGGWKQSDGSTYKKESRCSICGSQKTTYSKNGHTYSKCPKCGT